MATIRRAGFGTVFELEDSKVGIGTDAATHTLQALGNIRSEDATDIGISSLTTYQGFVDKEARFTTGQIDNQSQSGSTSGEIVIDGDVTVSSATTFTSGPQHLTVTDTFTLPSGDTNSREEKPTPGSLRFNQDFATLEFYTGNNWATVNTFTEMQNSPGNRGRVIFMGGSLDYPAGTETDKIDFINLSTLGNALDFGLLTSANDQVACCSSSIRGFRLGGNRPETDRIDYVTIASEGDAIDFGNLQSSKYGGGGCSSSTRGFFCGGFDNPADLNVIDYFEMMTLGNALDFGDLTYARRYGSSFSSPTRGFFTAGSPSGRGIDVFTMSSTGNATDFGDASARTSQLGGFANTTRGIYGNEQSRVDGVGLEHITLASEGNAIDFGNLGRATAAELGNGCNQTRGVLAGGFNTPGTASVNNIEHITIATTGNAQDFGDLSQPTSLFKGCSDSHGGLGGF